MKANQRFIEEMESIPLLFYKLVAENPVALSPVVGFPKVPAIYVFYHDGKAVHVGRTKNLQQRLRGHTTNSHYSASFAFKMARVRTGRMATYRQGESRAALLREPDFAQVFAEELAKIKGMSVRYLVVQDPIEQYLLELYAAIEFDTSLSEFETH